MFMYLQPGEVFQHTHTEYTITKLVEGEIDLEMNGERVALVPGMPTPVDAFTTHSLHNVGTVQGVAECVHLDSEARAVADEQPPPSE